MSWFNQGLPPHHTALAMVGAKAGDQVTIVGADDTALAAEIARVTALTGQTVVCADAAGADAQVNRAAADAGVLVEFIAAPPTALPFDAGSRDIAVIMIALASLEAPTQDAVLADAMRILRPGGRLVVLDGTRTTSVLGRLRTARRRLAAEDALRLLERAGGKARRQLADVDGVAYYEARRSP